MDTPEHRVWSSSRVASKASIHSKMTILGPSFAPRAAHLARVSLNRFDRRKKLSHGNGTVAAAAAVSFAGIAFLLTSHDSNVRTRFTKASETRSHNLSPKYHRFNGSICPIHTVRCDAKEDIGDSNAEDGEEEQLLPLEDNGEDSNELDSGYTEAERFSQCLEYHRSLLFDYYRRWGEADTVEDEVEDEQGESALKTKPSETDLNSWPRRVPTDSEINALETDLKFCLRDANQKENSGSCHNLQFRIAAYYLAQDDPFAQRTGFKKLKSLAEQGHPDAMCYYGECIIE